ncbi:SDR family NAD(P)-dependent oxidoreductase [Paraglaciecola chathamensis]|uniref:Estradiol 17-beta-dehydrogenase 8 n=1 Tax=Paraglaciecola agarilytica NO2 TaxID=1125747 RepID=A0ABQ0IAN3_9ALTE|nr:SDR family NAD(P)-dependent oxidoreductase [Paraglaciecola agarilytica]GAC06442.1 estradiol 17-beta-dehydrogenase 8 [Paraglaciecola agarilytica NO2]
MSFINKVAVVTGGGSGIGKAIVEQLARQGAIVYAFDLNEDKLKAAFGGSSAIHTLAVDVSNSSDVIAAFAQVETDQNRLDILINGAGINAPTAEANKMLVDANIQTLETLKNGQIPTFKFIEGTSDEDFDKVMRVNLYSQFYCIRAAVPLLKKSGAGSIVNISSAAAQVGVSMPLYYPASKAGVLGLTRGAASELAPYNIRVNAVCPGAVDTPLMHKQPREVVDFLVSMQPIKRMASPEEMARTVLFLTDEEQSSYYTGQTISPNGGLYM